MDKFVQLPFTIPPAPAAQFDVYLDWLSDRVKPEVPSDVPIVPIPLVDEGTPDRTERVKSDVDSSAKPVATDDIPSAQPDSGTSFAESRDVGAIVRAITRDAVANPREMKRMINLARFYLALRGERRRREAAWRAPSPAQYARWIAITLHWPDMMRWLQWGADEASWKTTGVIDNLVVRRLKKLERIAPEAADLEAWKSGLKAELMVPVEAESDWGCDPKLFEFFQEEGALAPSQRLSAAAQHGFW
jgi:hypothetical protein